MICETCSIEFPDQQPGCIRITDHKKWLLSPHPCPDCRERCLARAREAGKAWAAEMDRRILEVLKGSK